MSQKLREICVFAILFALPFAGAFTVEPWAAFLLCPLGVVGLLGLNESVGRISVRRPAPPRPAPEATRREHRAHR